ncbi:PLATZ transcription factor family protein [Trifolium pratense]|uniref:PLATZ transcription factor family protein n=1 Tax=Trifolium pratense TaxID=57577 RepID=A0A2K3LLU2_TRIPR|nr:PLATZ transcription factor family protein [Trifolium pratense]
MEEMEEMERLLEESIKECPPKDRARKSREQNLKQNVVGSRIDEENEEDEPKEEGNKESVIPVTRPPASFRKPDSRRKGIPHRAPFF